MRAPGARARLQKSQTILQTGEVLQIGLKQSMGFEPLTSRLGSWQSRAVQRKHSSELCLRLVWRRFSDAFVRGSTGKREAVHRIHRFTSAGAALPRARRLELPGSVDVPVAADNCVIPVRRVMD